MKIILVQEQQLPLFAGCIPETLLAHATDADNTLVLGAVDEETRSPAGVLLGSIQKSTFFIDWLYILPDWRAKGAASALFSQLYLSLNATSEVKRIATLYPETAPYEKLTDFLTEQNFSIVVEQGNAYAFEASKLAKAAFWQTPHDVTAIRTAAQLSDAQLKTLNFDLRKSGGSMVPLPIRREDYDARFTRFFLQGDRVIGLILIKSRPGYIEIPFVYAQSSKALPALLYSAGTSVIDQLPSDTQICLVAVTDTVESLVRKFFPDVDAIREVRAVLNLFHELEDGDL